ncbi:MAG: phage baseplate assembly protein V [Promethearchaeota archaeon]
MITFNDLKRLLMPIKRRLFLLAGRAILAVVNNDEGTQKIQITGLNKETITDVERFQEYGFETFPFPDAEVFTIFLNGNRDHGISLCVHDRRYRPDSLVEGELMIYTDENLEVDGHRIHFKRDQVIQTDCINTINNVLEKVEINTDETLLNSTTSVETNTDSNTLNAITSDTTNTIKRTVNASASDTKNTGACAINAASLTIAAPTTSIGGGIVSLATQGLILKLVNETFLTLFNAHVHIATVEGAPTLPPTVLATPANATINVQAS